MIAPIPLHIRRKKAVFCPYHQPVKRKGTPNVVFCLPIAFLMVCILQDAHAFGFVFPIVEKYGQSVVAAWRI